MGIPLAEVAGRLGPDARAQVEAQLRAESGRRATEPRKRTASEDKAALWLTYWRLSPATIGLPSPVAEHRFAPPRRFRFDWAWPDPAIKLAVEIDGGRWAPGGGKHGSDADRSKLNLAARMGWRVFRFAPGQLVREAPEAVAMVAEAVREAMR